MNNVQDLYNWAPVARVMLMGIIVALGPLAWIWMRNRKASSARRLRLITLMTLFLTFDLVLFGAFTRLTDSGLGCPDWPGCYGHGSPIGATEHIAAAQSAMPTGPVTHSKAWIEMVHRYLATGVGVLILTMTISAWMERRRTAVSPWWPTFTLGWVLLQGAFGAWTVTMKLFPLIVTGHLIGGLVLLVLLRVQSMQYAQAHGEAPRVAVGAGLRALMWAGAAALFTQVALGGWVSTNYAVLACTDFPMCNGSWWPSMDFGQGFRLWRELGMTHDGSYIGVEALTAIHYTHRLFAYAVVAVLGALAWRLWNVPGLGKPARVLAALVLMQVATGISNVVLDWPLAAAVLHTGGAAGLTVVLTGMLCASSRRAAPGLAHRSPAMQAPADGARLASPGVSP
ncbi:cytochrome c oxidase assembly protein subunit 15 [Comamonas sp. BIGb0124]|uniref:COX15/CtaA family protein n=1 Tax=Comamonas sp. BIGb0124 TaxID=2485130 RepID=UPI000F4AD1BE|nr:COX15/CtaA family protein [Comamonas sp. BIGb0124]ROR17052.1 cytochrome c oxidase assembly protein subunit 15 [Comamonas sp. BIGb0124]